MRDSILNSHNAINTMPLMHGDINKGLPPLELGDKPTSYFEFWPVWFFYAPVVVYWLALAIRYRGMGLPMLANPAIKLGGMVGESKSGILDAAGPLARSHILPYLLLDIDQRSFEEQALTALTCAGGKGFTLPMVVKPDKGCRGAGVEVIRSVEELACWLSRFPRDRQYILQQMAPYQAEAGIFYVRMPDEERGRITSITLKYVPCVIGDGQKTLKTLIREDPRAGKISHLYFPRLRRQLTSVPAAGEAVALVFTGSHCRGSIFRNGNDHNTEALETKIDEILRDFPDFHYGRLDIKFADMNALREGKDFVIIEVNGASSEATHIWDSRGTLSEVFNTLFRQYKTLFEIGNVFRERGHVPPSVVTLVREWLSELKQGKSYPSAD